MIKPDWDVDRARALYDTGVILPDIARACRINRNTLAKYMRRHAWPERPIDAERAEQFFVRKRDPEPPPVKRVARGASTLPPLASLDGGKG